MRTAICSISSASTVRANQQPDVAVLPLLWVPEFSASNLLVEVNLADYGYSADKFWPGALKSLTWQGKLYGIPTNNETHGFIWNKDDLSEGGAGPGKATHYLGRREELLQADQGQNGQGGLSVWSSPR